MIRPLFISSRQNPQFKRWTSLLESQGVKTHKQCLVSGNKIKEEIQRNSKISILEVILPSSCETLEDFTNQARCFSLSKELFHEVDAFGTKGPLFVCSTPPIPLCDLTQPPQGLEILCPIGDPGNMGALLRSCRAFGVRTVILLHEAINPFHPKVIRTSSGAVFGQSLNQACSITELHRPEILKWIHALDMVGEDVSTVFWPQHVRLLLGEEGAGIPSFDFPQRFSIPQSHMEIPLNATVASSIALHCYRQQHQQ